jgi:hypothetical protein
MLTKTNQDGNIVRQQVGVAPVNMVTEDSIQKDLSEQGTDNFIINGGFDFAQRIGAGTHTTTNTYGIDRWWLFHNHTTVTVSRQDITHEAANVRQCMRLANPTRGAGTYYYMWTPLETSNVIPMLGKYVTYSLYARKSSGLAAGTLKIGIVGHSGVDTAMGTIQSSGTDISMTTISNADLSTAWKRHSITMLIPIGFKTIAPIIGFLGSPTDGQYIEIKEVMLNIGTKAAPFKRAGNTFGGELALCQRYFEKTWDVDVAPGSAGGGYESPFYVTPISSSTRPLVHSQMFRVTKRTSPTVSQIGMWGAGGTVGGYGLLTNARCDIGSGSTTPNTLYSSGQNGFNFRVDDAIAVTTASMSYHWAVDVEL